MQCSLRDIFQRHDAAAALGRGLHPREQRAAWCIANCHTPALGGHLLVCPQGHGQSLQTHACRHRSCPRCAERSRAQWADAQLARLLPCAHFHVIFTLPHELLGLWAYNRERFTQALFDAVRGSLLALMGDPRHLGATPGLLMALHTWGRSLNYHPHVHALVTAGGFSERRGWLATREAWLLPLKPLRRLYAGRLLAALREQLAAGALALPPGLSAAHCSALLWRLQRGHWNIEIRPPYDSGRGVTLYLARYAKGGPLPKSRPLELVAQGRQVRFGYHDHRDGRAKVLCLRTEEFLTRILWHAPPKGIHTVRHAGLYATAARGHHRAASIALSLNTHALSPRSVGSVTAPAPASRGAALLPAPRPTPRCERCAQPLLRFRLAAQRCDQISPSVSAAARSGPERAPPPECLGTTIRSNGPPKPSRETSP